MTKTLTEQWKDMDLTDEHLYYWRMPNGEVRIMNKLSVCSYKLCYDGGKIDILEPVPSYDEIKRLQEQLKEAREVVKFYAETTVGHKQKDGTFTFYFFGSFPNNKNGCGYQELRYDPRPAKKWLKKWGVK